MEAAHILCIALAWLVLTLVTACLYGADWLRWPGDEVDSDLILVLLLVGVVWPLSLLFFLYELFTQKGAR